MNEIILTNPDKEAIYRCWHYCEKCFKTYTHSQADWEKIKKSKCCNDPNNLETISTKLNRLPIDKDLDGAF